MKSPWLRLSSNSIRLRLLVLSVSIFLVLALLLAGSNSYATNLIRKEVTASNENTLVMHMQRIDQLFKSLDRFLASMASKYAEISILENDEQTNQTAIATQTIYNYFEDAIYMYTYIEGFFLYSPETNRYIATANSSHTYEKKADFKRTIQSMFAQPPTGSQNMTWFPLDIYGQKYIMRYVRLQSTYVGILVSVEQLLAPFKTTGANPLDYVFFATHNGQNMSAGNISLPFAFDLQSETDKLNGASSGLFTADNGNRYLITSSNSISGDFALVALINEQKILEGLRTMRVIIILIFIALLLMIPFLLIFFQRTIVAPIDRIIAGMDQFGEGNFNVRLPEQRTKTSDEFRRINRTFNTMTEELRRLKIEAYENKLLEQKSRLQFYQLQIRPHFFTNTLNMIYSLAQVRKYKLVQELTLSLSEYYQHSLKNNADLVPLKDELSQINSYLKIQRLRFPYHLAFTSQIDPALNEAMIPPLLLQTFIENSVKYAMNMDTVVELRLNGARLESDPDKMVFTIEDTGPGFPPNILEALENGKRIVDERGEHIGIFNVQQRLWLVYGDQSEISFENTDGPGARIRIVLPIQTTAYSEVVPDESADR